jgi:hypothetical protein
MSPDKGNNDPEGGWNSMTNDSVAIPKGKDIEHLEFDLQEVNQIFNLAGKLYIGETVVGVHAVNNILYVTTQSK